MRDDVPPSIRVVDLGHERVARALPGLIRYLRREQPLALLSAMYHANLIAILAHWAARSRARLIVSERQSFIALQRNERSPKERLLRRAMRALYPRADAITTVSKALARELTDELGLSADRIFPIYNPVVSAAMLAKAQQEPEHPWFREDVPILIAVGRLVPEKDFATLLDAVALVARTRPVRLIILGEGPLRETLIAHAARNGIRERVDLPGRKSNPWSYMRKAAVFVLSSRSEGMPSVLVEALALGTPVVSTDCPTGPREILGDDAPGLVPVGDVAAMARAIEQALDTPPIMQPASIEAFHEDVSMRAHRDLLLSSVAPANGS